MTIAVVVIILALDRLTKFFMVKSLFLGQSIPVVKGFLHLTLVYNRGAAFGLLRNLVPLIVFTSIIAIVLLYVEIKKKKKGDIFYNLSLSLILSGALGNLIDRIFFGYVIDFIDFRVWPVFNIADSAITVGAILLGWSILIKGKTQNAKVKTTV